MSNPSVETTAEDPPRQTSVLGLKPHEIQQSGIDGRGRGAPTLRPTGQQRGGWGKGHSRGPQLHREDKERGSPAAQHTAKAWQPPQGTDRGPKGL